MIRHVIHDNDRARIIVEVQVGLVQIHLSWGANTGRLGEPSKASAGTLNLAPDAARDRLILFRAIDGLELVAFGKLEQEARRVPLDTIHRSIMDITRRPSA